MTTFVLAPIAVWLWEHPLPTLEATPLSIGLGLLLGVAVIVGGVWMMQQERKEEGK